VAALLNNRNPNLAVRLRPGRDVTPKRRYSSTVVDVVANILLGAAFLWAGALKLVQGPSWSKQAADMGVSRTVALAVPYVEVIVGAAVVSQLFKPWPAVVALALLVAYTVLIVLRLLDGSRPPCACFGSRSMRPLGPYHVLRNAALMALAVVAIVAA
jgi:hypothetical protein